MSSHLRRNSDGILTDCLCFGACCFSLPIHFSPRVCHASSLFLSLCFSLLLPPPSLPRFSEGWEQKMRIQVPARRHYGKHLLLRMAPHKDTTATGSFLLSCSLLFYISTTTTSSTSVSMSLCGSQTCLISRLNQTNWRWPCCERALCCIQIGKGALNILRSSCLSCYL